MKLEYYGRWLRLTLELFPPRQSWTARGTNPLRHREQATRRRRLLRNLRSGMTPPLGGR